MGGVRGKPPLLLDRGLEPVQGGVHGVRQAGDLVVALRQGDALVEVVCAEVGELQPDRLHRSKDASCGEPRAGCHDGGHGDNGGGQETCCAIEFGLFALQRVDGDHQAR